MPNTASGIPYPLATDPPNGASQMQALAAAVESLFAGQGAVSYGTAAAAAYTTTTSGATYAAALTANITIPSYWGGYRVMAFGSGRAATNSDLNMRISINGVAIATSEQGGIDGSMHTLASTSGTGGGTVPVVLQMSHNSVATVVQSPNIIAIAVRFS